MNDSFPIKNSLKITNAGLVILVQNGNFKGYDTQKFDNKQKA